MHFLKKKLRVIKLSSRRPKVACAFVPLNVQNHGQYPNIFCFSEKGNHVRYFGGSIVKIEFLVFSQSRFEISPPHRNPTGEFAWKLAAKLGEPTGCRLVVKVLHFVHFRAFFALRCIFHFALSCIFCTFCTF